jgi:hypothetical protein
MIMADTNDTKGEVKIDGIESKPPISPIPNPVAPKKPITGAPEPVILEEHIVERTSSAATAEDVGLKLPTPSPSVSVSLKPKPLIPPPPEAVDAPAGQILPPTIALSSEIPDMKASVSMPPPPKIETPPNVPPVIPPTSPNTADIQKILSQVKLPERRELKGAADPKVPPPEPQQIAKDLSAMVTKPPTDEESARAMMPTSETALISSMHTLKDDLQHAVKEKKMSLVRAVSLEQDKKRDALVEEDFGRKERRKRVAGILFASFLLIGLGSAALLGVYVVVVSHSGSNIESQNSIVFAEQSVALPLDNANASELKRRIAAARQTQIGSLGSIMRVVPLLRSGDPTIEPVQATTQEFFSALGFNAPTDLTKALGSAFFFGLHVVDENAPILVIPVTNYDRAFAAMLSWERTMSSDLSPVFTAVPSTILDVNGIPSSRVFVDDIIRNYDVRELKDDSGTVQLYYSFPSKNILIIAESPYSFPELLSRLQSVRQL